MEAGSPDYGWEGCRAGPRGTQPRGFRSWTLLPAVICLSITPGLSSQRGKASGLPELSFPSAWVTSQHFSVGHILN